MHLISFKDVGLRGRTGEFKEMCKNSISIKNVEIQPGQLNSFNISTFFSFVFANKSHKSTAGGKKTYLQSAFEPPPPFKISKSSCRGNKEDLALKKNHLC